MKEEKSLFFEDDIKEIIERMKKIEIEIRASERARCESRLAEYRKQEMIKIGGVIVNEKAIRADAEKHLIELIESGGIVPSYHTHAESYFKNCVLCRWEKLKGGLI